MRPIEQMSVGPTKGRKGRSIWGGDNQIMATSFLLHSFYFIFSTQVRLAPIPAPDGTT